MIWQPRLGPRDSTSALTRAAVEELAKSRTDVWLEQVLALAPTSVSHDEAIEALEAARDDFGARN